MVEIEGGEVVRGQITWDITGFDEDLALVKWERPGGLEQWWNGLNSSRMAAGSLVKRLVQLSGEKNSGLDQEVEVEVVKRDWKIRPGLHIAYWWVHIFQPLRDHRMRTKWVRCSSGIILFSCGILNRPPLLQYFCLNNCHMSGCRFQLTHT